jgi:hypothetical protein
MTNKLPIIDESDLSESGKVWRAWFDVVGDVTVKVINATAILVIAEREIYAGTKDAWLPIESAPKDGTELVLLGTIYDDDYQRLRSCVGRWHEEADAPAFTVGWQFSSPGYVAQFVPTHWMKLPD